MKLITLLLLTSCAEYQPRTYQQLTTYRIKGVKCSSNAYYSYQYDKCIALEMPEKPIEVIKPIKTVEHIRKAVKRLKTPNCGYILNKINQCSTEVR